jgi:hypothetical protein
MLAGSLSLAACSDSGSGNSTPTAAYVGAFEPDGKIVAGHGDRVATYAYPQVAIYRQDAADPALLAHQATLPGCGECNVYYLTVNDQWVTAAGDEAISYNPFITFGYVQFAPAGGTASGSRRFTIPDWTRVDRAAAWSDRLVAVSGQSIRLYDITAPAAPVLLGELDAGAASTTIAAAGGGVFVFTDNGYVFVDVVADTFSSVETADVSGVESAAEYDGKLHVAGRSKYAGYYRVARLDPSGAPALGVEADYDRIADGDTSTNDIAEGTFDAARGQYVVMSQTQPYPRSGEPAVSWLPRFSDGASIAPLDSVLLERPVCISDCPTTMNTEPRMYVNAGILYVIPDPSPSNVPIYGYRLP